MNSKYSYVLRTLKNLGTFFKCRPNYSSTASPRHYKVRPNSLNISMTDDVGKVVVPQKSDFDCFIELATDPLGWMKHYSSKSKYLPITAYTKIVHGNVVRAAKDPEFRKTWDDCMKEGSRICYVAPNSEIGYYRMKSPFGLKDRDFVNQRSCVVHKKMPPVEGVQRGISYVTGYLIKVLTPDSCDFTYISHSDPRGKVPSWVVNASVKTVGPIIVKRLYEAARTYTAWKANHDPDLKPWSNFHQMQELPPLDPADVGMLNTEGLGNDNGDADGEEEIPDESLLVPSNSDRGQSLNSVDNWLPIKGVDKA
ncbi:START domain-containing protein 10 [Taenia crassiceps]|uniref:START domain-containing protein 10 n=1 Tax=Taenia crassiceps TaxID=6207 RepID=A0ABR4QJ59_9CEST